MRFYKVASVTPVTTFMANEISKQLNSGKSVFWLLSGGSTANLALDVAQELSSVDTSKLTVSLIDERYGPVGHKDSNWSQILKHGFALANAKLQPILKGLSLTQTVTNYEKILASGLRCDFSIAFMGIGSDSHIAGIKPNSPAITAKSMAFAYDWDDYKGRITMTFNAIKKLDCSISYLTKETKSDAILALGKNLSLQDCPSQILKQVKKAIIFNDMLGEEL